MHKMTLKHTIKTQRFVEQNHDHCTECRRHFIDGDCTHLGYTQTRKLIYVGDCCSQILKETIIRHSYHKRLYSIPGEDATLWRFMDFTKFVSLLKTKSLFFTRADKFEDPFEGAKGLLKNKVKWNKHYKKFFIEAIKTVPGGKGLKKTEQELLKEAKRLLGEMSSIGERQVKETFINCWYENRYESEAMWKLYTSSLDQGIAIKSTYKRLYNSLHRDLKIHIGRINYIDFSSHFAGLNDSFWYKRKSFDHEKEVRAILKDFKSSENFGKLVPVNLNILIDKIFLSPTSQPWFKDLVCDIIAKYTLKKKIEISDMMAKPFH